MSTAAPDVVIPVREGAVNEWLRYSLRSLAAHLPHGRVWLVGHRPRWAVNIEHLPTPQTGTKFQNSTGAVRAACEHPDVSEQFVLSNDDMFLMHPQSGGMPVLHRGLVRDVEAHHAALGSGTYLRGMRETAALLADLGYPHPLSYELHVPMPVDKAGMLEALELGRHVDALHKRTLYGTLAEIGGQQIEDVKILHRAPTGYGPDSLFLSTMPDAFTNGRVGQFIRDAFPEPSPYETPGRR